MSDSLTLRLYAAKVLDSAGAEHYVQDEDRVYVQRWLREWPDTIRTWVFSEFIDTYMVGHRVEVLHRGMWRPGVVVGLGRKLVHAKFSRNRDGLISTRGFDAHSIRHRQEK